MATSKPRTQQPQIAVFVSDVVIANGILSDVVSSSLEKLFWLCPFRCSLRGVLKSDISAYHGRIMVSRSQPSNFLLPLKMCDTNSVLNSNAIFFITTSYLSK